MEYITIKRLRKHPKKTVVLLFGVVFTLLLLYIGWSVVELTVAARGMVRHGRAIAHAARRQDLASAKGEIALTRQALEQTEQKLKRLSFLRFVPVIGWYEQDGERALQAGFHGLNAADTIVETLTPYADILGLQGEGSFIGGTAQERMQLAVKTLDKVIPKLDGITLELSAAREEIDGIDAKRYPFNLGKFRFKTYLQQGKILLGQADTLLTDARPVLEVLPRVLGEPETQTYLVIFQNDKELRPTGGFMTAYAVMRMERGKLIAGRSEDMYRLDERRFGYVPPPDPIRRFLPHGDGGPAREWNIRDTNLSPDWRESVETFLKFYENVGGREPVLDGVIAIDTYLVQEILAVTGPVDAVGLTFSAEQDPRCDCPRVVYELENYAENSARVAIAKGQDVERKGILAPLMSALMDAALGAGREKYAPLFEAFVKAGKEKHILLYFQDEKAQAAAEQFGWAGRITATEGDYLHINDANFAGAKANMYVQQSVEQAMTIEQDGSVTKTVTIEYRNPKEDDGWLNGKYRDWVRLYVPLGSRLLESSGSEVDVGVNEDLGKTVFDAFFTLNPKNLVRLTFTYTLPFTVQDEYSLMLQKQPGKDVIEHTIIFNGKTKPTIKLSQDTKVTYPI